MSTFARSLGPLLATVLVPIAFLAACTKTEDRTSANPPPTATAPVEAVKPAPPPEPAPPPSAPVATAELQVTGGDPATALDVPPGSAFNTTLQNSLDDTLVDNDEGFVYKQVRQRLSQVNRCYAKQRQAEPTLAGKLVVKITVAPAPTGSVTQAEIVEKSLKSSEVEGCVMNTVKGFKFARKAPEPLVVNLPFIFR
jgi:hypothetical protein